MRSRFWVLAILFVVVPISVQAQLRLENVRLVVEDHERFNVPATVLVEEVASRTGITWPIGDRNEQIGSIAFRLATSVDGVTNEGFKIETQTGAVPRLTIAAQSRRGALYGVGFLLRQLDSSKGRVSLPKPLNVTESPRYAIRGHQLGYRSQANSYDAWDAKTYEKYIRELTFFGNNCIENIPFQDDRPTPVMPISRKEMNRVMASLCEKYDVDYWVWTPADFDLEDAKRRAAAIEFHESFYKECPRLDAIFFPGGDPGDNHPRDVLPFLEDLSKILPKYHPKAKIWMSLQGFNAEKTDYFFTWLAEHRPDWLGGLVAGPGSPPLPKLRERLDKKYPLRDYPDITHVVRCQYPELNLDQVFALTAGREAINPRPSFYTRVFAETAPHTNGYLSYSDGCHDDVNKVIWNALAWNPEQKPRSILIEYARAFFGNADAELVAYGILALEMNWEGSLRDNKGVPGTLELWQRLEKAHPELRGNWRWQMLLIRAYYDGYQRERLIRETAIEQQANAELEQKPGRTPSSAMQAALRVLSQAETNPTRPDLRSRLIELFEQLYSSIKFQSSVEKYHAIHPQRGCMLEFLDYPLNNRFWLEDEFHKVLTLPTLEARWERLDTIRTWESPGPGSFYDDIGNLARSPHAVRRTDRVSEAGSYWWVDNGMSRQRLSWLITGSPASLEYEDLDPNASYLLRFSGFGELKPKANGQPLASKKYETAMNTMKEFPVPQELLKDGKLSVSFDNVRMEGVNWRFQPRLAEAWLIKGPKAEAVKPETTE